MVIYLTEKQKRFVDYYIQTSNASEAARRAGYSAKVANRIATENLSKPVIKKAIDTRLKELDDKRTADTKEILHYMTSVMRGELSEEVVSAVSTGDGCFEPKIVMKKFGIKERSKCAEMLARVRGLFNDNLNVNSPNVVKIIDYIPASDAE